MHPILFHLGAFPITSYGAALTIAFAVGTAVAMRRARQSDLDPERVLETAMVVLVSALLGARLFYVVMNPDEFAHVGWLARLLPFAPDGAYTGVVGLSVMGGLPLSLLAGYLFLRMRGDPWWPMMDVMAPSVALGAGITRVGCFLNGCCHGAVCDWPWAVHFPANSLPDTVFPGAALHPTQLYAAAAGFAIFVILLAYARRKPPAGSILAALCIGMGGQRFVIETFRYHTPNESWTLFGGIESTVYHGVAAGLVVLGIALLLRATAAQRLSRVPGAGDRAPGVLPT